VFKAGLVLNCINFAFMFRLINQFGWKGAMLITAGLVLNCIIFGALFRPLKAPKKSKKTEVSIKINAEVKLRD
jgi:O-antigen/teichoic acid export membrane protein